MNPSAFDVAAGSYAFVTLIHFGLNALDAQREKHAARDDLAAFEGAVAPENEYRRILAAAPAPVTEDPAVPRADRRGVRGHLPVLLLVLLAAVAYLVDRLWLAERHDLTDNQTPARAGTGDPS